jgi:hypothetical protein
MSGMGLLIAGFSEQGVVKVLFVKYRFRCNPIFCRLITYPIHPMPATAHSIEGGSA